MFNLILTATLETLEMVFVPTLISILVGLPIALLIIATGPLKLYRIPGANFIAGWIVDAGRAVPFIILLVLLIPVTRCIAGTSLGTTAALVPLSIAGIPYFARLAQLSLSEVSPSLVDAVRAMGGTRFTILSYVILPEALPALIGSTTITLITMVSASAMAGVIGAGGLGDLAIRYGYQRFNVEIMTIVVIILIAMVCIIQYTGDKLSNCLRK